jgi:hypothetical protein
MSSIPASQGLNIAIFWLFMGSLCIAWGGARLFLPQRRRLRPVSHHPSRIERGHAYKLSKGRRKKSRQYRLIGLASLLAGAIGLFFSIRFFLES